MAKDVTIAGEALGNVPWEDRPADCDEVVWRYSGNPVIPRGAIPCANSIFNSAVVPFQGRFAGVFRVDDRTRNMRLHAGRSSDGFHFELDPEPIRWQCEDPEIAQFVEAYDPRVIVWDGDSGNTLRIITDELATELQAIDLSADGKLLATTNGGGAKIWETSTGTMLRFFPNDNSDRMDIDPDRKWTDEEKALVETVSEQLAQTVENLRLFDDTRQRAGREQVTRYITDKMRAAPDADSIIQVGMQELARVLGSSHVVVELDASGDGQEMAGDHRE